MLNRISLFYFISCRLFGVLFRYKNNLPVLMQQLERMRQHYRSVTMNFETIEMLFKKIYWYSPWIWGHTCLYKSLFFFILSRDVTLNIGIEIRYSGQQAGHCWATIHGAFINTEDEKFAQIYSQKFTQFEDIIYWLPNTPVSGKDFSPKPMKIPALKGIAKKG